MERTVLSEDFYDAQNRALELSKGHGAVSLGIRLPGDCLADFRSNGMGRWTVRSDMPIDLTAVFDIAIVSESRNEKSFLEELFGSKPIYHIISDNPRLRSWDGA